MSCVFVRPTIPSRSRPAAEFHKGRAGCRNFISQPFHQNSICLFRNRNLLVETVRRQFSKILAALIRLKHVDFFVFWCPMEPTKCIESDQHHIKPIQTRCITLPETNIAPENGWLEVGIQLSIWEGLFSGAM